MKIAIVQFPGSNCERETRLAVERAGMEAVDFLWNEKARELSEFDGFVLVGGFSYEDRSRAGIIASFDKVVTQIKEEAQKGKPVLGICNGAQILVESGLVPGLANHELAVALTTNKRVQHDKVIGTGFYNAWVNIRSGENASPNAFNLALSERTTLNIPVAHAEGRFTLSKELLSQLIKSGQIAFQYCDAERNVVNEFPINPNGSVANIAAITNYAGNVMAMMPHPERCNEGDVIFQSMRDFIAEKEGVRSGQLNFSVKKPEITAYQTKHNEILVDYAITDNQAITVQNTLQKLGIPVTVKRLTHWEINCEKQTVQSIIETEELLNPRKEFEVKFSDFETPESVALLVKPYEDIVAQQKFELLANHFEVDGIKSINRSDVWLLTASAGSIEDHVRKILESHILCNPHAQQCFFYS